MGHLSSSHGSNFASSSFSLSLDRVSLTFFSLWGSSKCFHILFIPYKKGLQTQNCIRQRHLHLGIVRWLISHCSHPRLLCGWVYRSPHHRSRRTLPLKPATASKY